MDRSGLIAGTAALLLLAGCVTKGANVAPPEPEIDKKASFGFFSLAQRVYGRGQYIEVPALKEPFQVRLKGNAAAVCTHTTYSKRPGFRAAIILQFHSNHEVVDGRTFRFRMSRDGGATVTGTAPVTDDGNIDEAIVEADGRGIEDVPPAELDRLKKGISENHTVRSYAGLTVRSGDKFLREGLLERGVRAELKTLSPDATLKTYTENIKVRGTTIVNGRQTLLSDGRINASADVDGQQIDIVMRPVIAIDMSTGLLKDFMLLTQTIADGKTMVEHASHEECEVTGGL